VSVDANSPEEKARRRIAKAERSRSLSLNLSGFGLASVPDTIGQLTSLTELDLSDNQLASVPDVVGQLTTLTKLYLYSNQLTSFPDVVGQLTALTKLYLGGNQLASVPDVVGQLTALTELNLGGNQLTMLPDAIGQLTRLTTLGLGGNQLASLPDAIGQLTGLTELNLGGNQLTSLPDVVGQLTGLTKLYLDENQLASLPDAIGQLTGLIKLSSYGNRLASVPDAIGQLTGLTWLDLSNNQLTMLPDAIGQLTGLAKLYLHVNQLASLPDAIGQLTGLTILGLNDNQLASLPDTIGQLTRLTTPTFSNNPFLSSLPPEVTARGDQAVLTFLRAQAASSVERWHSKILIVGEATVGKTSLAKQLLSEPFDPAERQTHGVRIRTLPLSHPDRPGVTMDLDVWDFGGQLEYRATQRFYLTDRSLFLLVWNSRARAADGKITAWLDAVTARAPGSPILLVATHGDEHSPATLPGDLAEKYPNILATHTIDSRTGRGLDQLCQDITRRAAALPLMGVRWPTTWERAARAVSDLPGLTATAHRILHAMAQAGVTDPDEQQTIARILHDLGQIAYFADNPDLATKVILQPAWLDARITQAIDSHAVTDAGGVLSRAERQRLWGDLAENEDDPDLPDRLIRMMETFDLAYRVGNAQDSADVALIVDRLPDSPPLEPERAWREHSGKPGMREIAVIYKLASRQAGIPGWFIAREHRYTTALHWRYGVLLHDRDPDTPAWALLTDDGRDQPTITLRVTGSYPVRFHSVLTEAFDTIIEDRYPGLVEQRLVPCVCQSADGERCLHAFTLEELLAEATADEPDADHKVRCPKTKRKIEAALMLDGLRGTGLVIQLEAHHREITANLDALRQQAAAQTSTLTAIDARAQATLNAVRTLLEHRADAGVHCPALFSIQPAGRTRILRHERLTLTLWCEWESGPHPLDGQDGRYTITKLPQALARYLPYLRHLITALSLATPALAAGTALGDRVTAGFQAATRTLEYIKSHTELGPLPGDTGPDPHAGPARTRRAESGADFRALQSMLRALDPGNEKNWGALSPASRPEDRRIIYLCPEHLRELDYPYTANRPTP
jgi:internalin A